MSDKTSQLPAHRAQSDQAEAEAIENPAQALGLVNEQNRRVSSMLASGSQRICLVWGLVWMVAYLTLAVSSLLNHAVPSLWAFLLYGLAIMVGVVLSIVLGVRTGSGFRGESNIRGTAFGWSWILAFIFGMSMCTVMVTHFGLQDWQISMLYNSVAVLIVGIQYMAGSSLGSFDLPMFLCVVFMLLLCVVTLFLAGTVGYLVMALLGGGCFLALALLTYRANRVRGVRGDEHVV
ncbi:hypothetical protein CRD60_03100 [Bifidobacterium aemilianum]|uniref:Uncharacterized protein n=1 Tax=Bifidobacterium aemilianum TaxID=2493120 RepID=A0A366K904_9BIFI|nr:hypothetical protein [Bifidobacterium aemilianum]RBP98149.1 hypothetical protein CRD60_03100 [Bifidobacterium aemilianum]